MVQVELVIGWGEEGQQEDEWSLCLLHALNTTGFIVPVFLHLIRWEFYLKGREILSNEGFCLFVCLLVCGLLLLLLFLHDLGEMVIHFPSTLKLFLPRESGSLTSLPALLDGVSDLELCPGGLKQMWFAESNGHQLSPVENWPRSQWGGAGSQAVPGFVYELGELCASSSHRVLLVRTRSLLCVCMNRAVSSVLSQFPLPNCEQMHVKLGLMELLRGALNLSRAQ